MDDGKFTKVKKFLAFTFGIAVLWASIVFSKNGFEFKTTSEYAWIGWVLAFAATVSQFMMNSSFKKINWTILVLGLVSYAYSIYTNMLGFHSLRETESIWNILNVCGSFFMDVFPEVSIAWSLDESKVGDLFGNLLKSSQNPELLSKTQEVERKFSSGFSGQQNQFQPQKQNIPLNIPRQNNQSQSQGSRNSNSNRSQEGHGGGQQQAQNFRPSPKLTSNNNGNRQERQQSEPTYHPITYMPNKEEEGFDA